MIRESYDVTAKRGRFDWSSRDAARVLRRIHRWLLPFCTHLMQSHVYMVDTSVEGP
jgi:hypothetical protein